MTHSREPRVIGNHADMGGATAKQQEYSGDSHTALSATDGLRAGGRHGSRRQVSSEGESPQDSAGATTAPDEPDGGGRQ